MYFANYAHVAHHLLYQYTGGGGGGVQFLNIMLCVLVAHNFRPYSPIILVELIKEWLPIHLQIDVFSLYYSHYSM